MARIVVGSIWKVNNKKGVSPLYRLVLKPNAKSFLETVMASENPSVAVENKAYQIEMLENAVKEKKLGLDMAEKRRKSLDRWGAEDKTKNLLFEVAVYTSNVPKT